MQEEHSDDFEQCGFLDGHFFPNIKKIRPKLKSLIDNFNKYCGNSTKPASDIITAIQNYLPTDDFIEFVEYLVKEYDLDIHALGE